MEEDAELEKKPLQNKHSKAMPVIRSKAFRKETFELSTSDRKRMRINSKENKRKGKKDPISGHHVKSSERRETIQGEATSQIR